MSAGYSIFTSFGDGNKDFYYNIEVLFAHQKAFKVLRETNSIGLGSVAFMASPAGPSLSFPSSLAEGVKMQIRAYEMGTSAEQQTRIWASNCFSLCCTLIVLVSE